MVAMIRARGVNFDGVTRGLTTIGAEFYRLGIRVPVYFSDSLVQAVSWVLYAENERVIYLREAIAAVLLESVHLLEVREAVIRESLEYPTNRVE